jgi:hypothetical protein
MYVDKRLCLEMCTLRARIRTYVGKIDIQDLTQIFRFIEYIWLCKSGYFWNLATMKENQFEDQKDALYQL